MSSRFQAATVRARQQIAAAQIAARQLIERIDTRDAEAVRLPAIVIRESRAAAETLDRAIGYETEEGRTGT